MMAITFKSERKKVLKSMYNSMCDAYAENLKYNPNITRGEKEEILNDAKAWKEEFKLLLDDL